MVIYPHIPIVSCYFCLYCQSLHTLDLFALIFLLMFLFPSVYSLCALILTSVWLLLTDALLNFHSFIFLNVFVQIHFLWLYFSGPSTSWHVDVIAFFTPFHFLSMVISSCSSWRKKVVSFMFACPHVQLFLSLSFYQAARRWCLDACWTCKSWRALLYFFSMHISMVFMSHCCQSSFPDVYISL